MKPTKRPIQRPRRPEPVLPLEPRRLLSTALPAFPWSVAFPLTTKAMLFQEHAVTVNTSHSVTAEHKPAHKKSTGGGSSGTSAPSATAFDSLTASPNSAPGSLASASLAGRVIYTSGGHGYVWRDSSSSWGFMRPYLNSMVEDLGNQDQIEPFANYLLQAGATVVPMRPVGHQTNEVIVDNASTYSPSTGGFQVISGSWTNMTDGPYWSNSPTGSDAVHYVTAATSSTETAVARFTPDIPAAGYYPVYAWYNPGANSSANDRVSDQTFRINYSGGSYEVKVAANKTGKGWVYLGDYYFAAGVNGASGSVEVSNKSATTGKKVVADAIRFGNGMGDVNYSYTYPNGTSKAPVMKSMPASGQAREDEAALYWCYAERGWESPDNRVAPSSVYGGTSTDDETKNFSACDAFAVYMNQQSVGSNRDRLWLSFHSNATNGGATRGTLGLINSPPTTNQADLALIAGRVIQDGMQGLDSSHEFSWAMNQTPTFSGGYSEISANVIGTEFDATIVEVAYHDNATDAALLKDPAVRDDVGEAAYHAVVQYFKKYGSLTNTTYLPEPPADVRATTDASGNVTVSWNPGPSSAPMPSYDPSNTGADDATTPADNPGPYGNPATAYKVYTSVNGHGFDGGVTVSSGTSLTFNSLSTTSPTYFKVAALNAGGESLGSYVVVAKPQSTGTRAPLLIVNGFTRVDDNGDQIVPTYAGAAARARYRYNNTFDYVTQAASSVSAYNPALGIESAPASAVSSGLVNLSNYQAVIWLSGEQADVSGANPDRFVTLDAPAQTAISNYLNAGGKLFLSGANLAWDLSSSGANHGSSFLSSTLHTTYVRDDTNTHAFTAGASGAAFAAVPAGSFDDGTHGTYDVDAPDGISPAAGATAALSYSGGTGGTAAVQYASGNSRLLLLAFPLESVYTQSTRDALVAGALNYFGFSGTAPTPAPGTPDLADASDHGPSNSDNVTNLNNTPAKTLQFTIPNTVPGATVQLFADGTLIGQATATTTSTTITTNGTATLSDAAHSITAVQTAPGSGPSASAPPTTVTIDTASPTATFPNIVSPLSTPLSSYSVAFSEPVFGLDPADLAVSRDGAPVAPGPAQTLSASGNTYILNNLAALTANAGAYTLSLFAATSGVTDLAGNPLAADRSVSWRLNAITGTGGNDDVRIARNPADPTSLDVTVDGAPTYTVKLAGLGNLTVTTGDGDDRLTLDYSAGQPAFDAGATLTYLSGNSTAAGDSIAVIGTSGADQLTAHAFTLSMNGGPAVKYSTTSVTPVSVSFKGAGGADVLSLYDRLFTFPSDLSADTPNLTLNVGAGANAIFLATQHLSALNISDTASLAPGGNKVLVVGSLAFPGETGLDLADNDLVIDPALAPAGAPVLTPDALRQFLQQGLIFSSAAQSNPQHTTALGYGDSASLGLSTFSNQPVDASALLVKYTYNGDTNLDGQVTYDDLARIDRGRAKALTGWLWGDTDYNGVVDSADATLAYTAFALQSAPL